MFIEDDIEDDERQQTRYSCAGDAVAVLQAASIKG